VPQGKPVAARSAPKPVQELVSQRTAFTSTWRDSDGSISVKSYLAPHFYQDSSGHWSPIDSNVSAVKGRPGWFQSGANSWQAAFGPAGAAGGAEQLTVAGHEFGFSPQGVNDPAQAPSAAKESVTYSDIWNHVDLAEHVTATGVNEDIVVKAPGAPSTYSFGLAGATVVADPSGGIDVFAGGKRVGTLPAPVVTVHSGQPMDQTAASKVRMTVVNDVIQVSLSADWLAGLPASAFPVVIDPTFDGGSSPSSVISVNDAGTQHFGVMENGFESIHPIRSAAFFPPPTLPTPQSGAGPWSLANAQLELFCVDTCKLFDVNLIGMSNAPTSTPTYAGIGFGQQLLVGASQAEQIGGMAVSGTKELLNYMRGRTDGWWFGVVTSHALAQDGVTPVATFDTSLSNLQYTYVSQPPATSITYPIGNTSISTTTPTLVAAPVANGESAAYDFRLSTSSDNSGIVVDSGWLDNQTSWTVPPGSLHDGVTYYSTVLTSVPNGNYSSDPNNVPHTPPASPVIFEVKERLGGGGPSPTDTVGATPAGTVTPSGGSPSPGVTPASETVNMLTGNLAVSLGTPAMQTVSGRAGVSLTYNSASSSVAKGTNYGLTGSYYTDGGGHDFSGTSAGQRLDSGINAHWGSKPAIGGLTMAPFMVRWTGVLSLPAGTWQLGGLTTGGMRIFLNSSTTPTYDDWAGAATSATASFGSVTVNGSHQYQIEVDDWDPRTAAQPMVELWANDTDAGGAVVIVPSSWLTPVATGVPPGWSLSTNAASASWIHADDQGNQVVLQGTSGRTAAFTRIEPGLYQAAPGNDDFLDLDGNGRLQLSTADGHLYRFNLDGSLASMTTIADDLHPAALQYTYNGTPALMRTITDPVSGRNITLAYGGDAGCPTTNPAPAGMLCQISYWDGTAATFGYNGNGQIASVTNPGNVTTLFGYDSDSRLADIRDALAGDYLASGGQTGTSVNCAAGLTGLAVPPVDTQICYDSSGRVATVTQPAPTPGASRPGRTYTYGAGHTDMSIAGFSPASGYAQRTAYDDQGRITQQIDSTGHTTTTVWANTKAPNVYCPNICGRDEPIVSATPAGLQTSTVYDQNGNVIDTYGPAPLACFSGGWPYGAATPTAPVQGYLPVANPQGTTGCGIAAIPHSHNGYDEGVTGLAASYWSNGQAAGPVTKHATGLQGAQPSSLCITPGPGLCTQWPAGSPPVGSDASGHWFLRLTGMINLTGSGATYFGITTTQAITLSVDGEVMMHNGPDVYGFVPGQEQFLGETDDEAHGLAGGVHHIEVDFEGSATQLNDFAIEYEFWSDPGFPGASRVIPDSVLDPGYGLLTSTTDADGHVTTTAYTAANLGPEFGLPTAKTLGAGTSTALTTTSGYETPGPGSFLRKTSSTLPAGNATTYTYYTGTGGPVAAACGVAANTPQGGQLQAQIEPAPTAGAPAREKQYIYDARGRQVGARVGLTTTIGSADWQCTTFDTRGRVANQSWPAVGTAPARTVTHTYSVGGNPLVANVSDPAGTVTSTVDLQGRLTSYTDVYGKTTTVTYNQAGQTTATAGPQGSTTNGYDANSGNLSTVTVNGTLLATTQYDTATGRLTGVTYGNGTTAALGYDPVSGGQNSLVFTNTSTGAFIAGNQLTRSPGQRIVSELEDINGTSLTNPNPAGSSATDYSYDGAGRLVTAYLPGAVATYGYGANPAGDNCANPGQGANTNRTNLTVTPTSGSATNTDYCYNGADQLTSTITSSGTNTQYGYDPRGNQTNDRGTAITWDAADRMASTTVAGATTTYTYDALDRVISHANPSATTHYAYGGYTTSAVAALDASNNVVQRLISLPGGVLVTAASTNTWSYPDLHGNNIVLTDNSGVRQGSPVLYDPWGGPAAGSSPLNNASGGNTLGAFGSSGKLTDSASSITILDARPYLAAEGRFLSVDPIEGGCANNYVYVFGDPLNTSDLSGRLSCSTNNPDWPPGGQGSGGSDGGGDNELLHDLEVDGAATLYGIGAAVIVGSASTLLLGGIPIIGPSLAGGATGFAYGFTKSVVTQMLTSPRIDFCAAAIGATDDMIAGGVIGFLVGGGAEAAAAVAAL
jgi:RHS repeat-associated protein